MIQSNKQPTIICIVGPSGSGKTTLAKHLSEKLNIPTLVSYTTRPMRKGEVNGVDHWFVSENEMPNKSQMLAYTQFGGYHYWTSLASVNSHDICTYVIDEKGLRDLIERYKDRFNIFGVLIKRGIESLIAQVGEDRVMRDLERDLIPESDYSLVLENYGTLGELLYESTQIIKNIFN